jgi:hypothetical protein
MEVKLKLNDLKIKLPKNGCFGYSEIKAQDFTLWVLHDINPETEITLCFNEKNTFEYFDNKILFDNNYILKSFQKYWNNNIENVNHIIEDNDIIKFLSSL